MPWASVSDHNPAVLQPNTSAAPASSAPMPSGIDYESLTLMRLRQAERDRLEREIREREAEEA